MPQIIYTEAFISDFERLYLFLNKENPRAAQKLAAVLEERLEILATIPKAFAFFGEFRVYMLEFGSAGYAILYDYSVETDQIIMLRIKHQKEAGF